MLHLHHRPWPVLALALLIPFGVVSPVCAQQQFSGAGSSAAAPVYRAWAREYAKSRGENLSYEPVGSGAGMTRIRKREVDFGASDIISSKAELDRDGLVMVPTVIIGIVPVVNLPKVAPNALHLTGQVLAQIFLGEVSQWDAAPIKALNPELSLPNLPIRIVARSDGSGTTYHFSDYLSRVSPAWKQRYGVAPKFDWPAGVITAKGSSEVSKAVRATAGAIGYIDYNYVLDDALSGVSLRNADGQFVAASVEGFREAVVHSAWFTAGDFGSEINEGPGARTWPITMGTYIAVPRVAKRGDRTESALRFITWGYLNGDVLAREAKFVPLPNKVQANAYKEIASVRTDAGDALGMRLLGTLVR
jgi:phosphate transport system substrate-binding protein